MHNYQSKLKYQGPVLQPSAILIPIQSNLGFIFIRKTTENPNKMPKKPAEIESRHISHLFPYHNDLQTVKTHSLFTICEQTKSLKTSEIRGPEIYNLSVESI